MTAMERVAAFNGTILPERDVRISFRDIGFTVGDGAFDSARSVARKPFLFREHVDRLFRSLAYLRIDPGMSAEQMLELTLDVFERNLPLLGEHDDYWVTQWVSRGVRTLGRTGIEGGATVIIECEPLPFKTRARGMRDGLEVVTPGGVRRTPPEAISPRLKSLSYGNLVAGDVEVQALKPGATCVLLDTRGCLCEGLGSNIFIVRNGEVLTAHERFVLAGLSRQTAIGIAREQSIPVREADIDLYDAYTADEAFITSTSWCLVPVRTINGKALAAGAWGPVTRRLSEGYKARLSGFDYVAQYTRHND
jgi:branched-chain amino acid aminotransferase